MAKYTLFGSISLLIISIILFSSFIKDNPSYIGIAHSVSKVNNNKSTELKADYIRDYGKSNIPEIAPITIIHQDTPKLISIEEENKDLVKKEVPKKKKKKPEIVTPVKEEIPLVKADTFEGPIVASPDTSSSKTPNDQIQEPDQKKKKKKKKFLFF